MMKCTMEVQRECPYSYMCGTDCEVSDDSECADFIMEVTMRRVKAQEAADAMEAEYIQQEREAIQEETLPDFARKFTDNSYQ